MGVKKILWISFIHIAFFAKAQVVTKAFIKKGNTYVQYDNADIRQITYKSIDSKVVLSKNKRFLIYLQEIDKNSNKSIIETKIIFYDFAAASEKVIVQGCKTNGSGSSAFLYEESNEYPFAGLCNISNMLLSPDGQRVYFETEAWAVCSAIHYYNINNGKIGFVGAGTLNEIFDNGDLSITITGIEDNVGRFLQDWLFDKNGNKIKSIGEKNF